ncbi:MAG TPA: hypothetical protein PK339_01930 [Flavitalea sp.]|nr:hypothetical protein [Flavitalea sp.]
MKEAKITLSAEELAIAQNADWLLTKNAIIEKVYHLFGLMSETLKAYEGNASFSSFPELFLASPKIARGENYRGLPYVMLDYPRRFGKEDIFAVRTMFWWGNFFSVTLHLKGKYKKHFLPVLLKNMERLAAMDFMAATDEDEWRHDLLPEHYKKLAGLDAATCARVLGEKAYCKLTASIPLDQWNRLNASLPAYYRELFQALGS